MVELNAWVVGPTSAADVAIRVHADKSFRRSRSGSKSTSEYEGSDREGLLQGHIYRASQCIRLARNGTTCNDAAINLR